MMFSSPITLSKDDDSHIQTILIVLEQQFTRSYGQPIPASRVILHNDTFRRLAEDNRFVASRREDQIFVRNFLEDVIRNNRRVKDQYEVQMPTERTGRKEQDLAMRIMRKNQYPNIRSDKDLRQLIAANPGGLEVNDQLLHFTYRRIGEDLERLHKENAFRRLWRDKGGKNYLIFPKKEENEWQIHQNEHKEFTFHRYLELCASINAKQPERELNEAGRKTAGQKRSQPDRNYQLEGYVELKEQWLKRNKK